MKPKTPKNLKKWHYSASGLWFGLHDLHWPFIFFQESLMSKKSSGMQKNIFRPLFHQHQFPNEIFQNRSVCYVPVKPVFSRSWRQILSPFYQHRCRQQLYTTRNTTAEAALPHSGEDMLHESDFKCMQKKTKNKYLFTIYGIESGQMVLRGKSLLESWGTSFLPDWQTLLIFV